jgi:hypothetical protein
MHAMNLKAITLTLLLTSLACMPARAQVRGEFLITDHGARGDNHFDNGPVINGLIAKFGPAGGTIIVPAGDFRINSPIVINSDNITIRGVNYGQRSFIDPTPPGIFGPAGGSKIILGAGVEHGIAVFGAENPVSGLTIRDLAVQGSDGAVYQIGIFVDRPNRRTLISNVNCIALRKAIYMRDSDEAVVENSWLAECESPLHMHRGNNCIVADNALGGQPGGVTADFHGHARLTFTGNNVFPDGYTALFITNGHHCTITDNTFTNWYAGIIQIEGNMNLLAHNQINAVRGHDGNWPNDPRARDDMFGIIRIAGNDNVLASNTIFSWQPDGHTRVHVAAGERNVLRNLYIGAAPSNRRIFANGEHTQGTLITRSGHPHEIDAPTARITFDP